jgi:hypothetical protein
MDLLGVCVTLKMTAESPTISLTRICQLKPCHISEHSTLLQLALVF